MAISPHGTDSKITLFSLHVSRGYPTTGATPAAPGVGAGIGFYFKATENASVTTDAGSCRPTSRSGVIYRKP